MSDNNKELVQSAKDLLTEMGVEVKTTQLYELFAKLSGQPNWNVAAAKNVDLRAHVIPNYRPETIDVTDSPGGNWFMVKIKANAEDEHGNSIELSKFYKVPAKTEPEARKIVEAYVAIRFSDEDVGTVWGDDCPKALTDLLQSETEDDFTHGNWNVIWNDVQAKVTEVYSK